MKDMISSPLLILPRQIQRAQSHQRCSTNFPSNNSTANMVESSQEPDLAHFQQIPWCAQLLSGPDIVITPTNSREYKSSTEDALFAETFKTDDTISACLSFHTRPEPDATHIPEIHTLLTLGYRLNGYPGVAHGGVIATVLDEIMGMLLGINKRSPAAAAVAMPLGDTVTAYLNVTYVRPVPTPSTVLVSAGFREVVGRKFFLEGTVKDGEGVVLAKAEALFVRMGKSKGMEML